jgi:hypothetical protein
VFDVAFGGDPPDVLDDNRGALGESAIEMMVLRYDRWRLIVGVELAVHRTEE